VVLVHDRAIMTVPMTDLVLAALFLPISTSASRARRSARSSPCAGRARLTGFYSLVTVVAFGWLIVAYGMLPDYHALVHFRRC